MRRYVIFGPGRVGRNFAEFARGLGHQATLISKIEAETEPEKCRTLICAADVVAAAIPDSKLVTWADEWRNVIGSRQAIHFSGASRVEGCFGYHPLFSFPPEPMPANAFAAIAIAREPGSPLWRRIVPGAENPEFVVADHDRAFYHALAVLAGNMSAFVWNRAASSMGDRLSVDPAETLVPYLRSVVDRFEESPAASLTGPVARRDAVTVSANLAALAETPALEGLYRAFLAAAWPDWESEKIGP